MLSLQWANHKCHITKDTLKIREASKAKIKVLPFLHQFGISYNVTKYNKILM